MFKVWSDTIFGWQLDEKANLVADMSVEGNLMSWLKPAKAIKNLLLQQIPIFL